MTLSLLSCYREIVDPFLFLLRIMSCFSSLYILLGLILLANNSIWFGCFTMPWGHIMIVSLSVLVSVHLLQLLCLHVFQFVIRTTSVLHVSTSVLIHNTDTTVDEPVLLYGCAGCVLVILDGTDSLWTFISKSHLLCLLLVVTYGPVILSRTGHQQYRGHPTTASPHPAWPLPWWTLPGWERGRGGLFLSSPSQLHTESSCQSTTWQHSQISLYLCHHSINDMKCEVLIHFSVFTTHAVRR